jgi:hypothetical protein
MKRKGRTEVFITLASGIHKPKYGASTVPLHNYCSDTVMLENLLQLTGYVVF